MDIQEQSVDGKLYAQRDIIQRSLDEIAADVGVALRDAGLTCPVFRKLTRNCRHTDRSA